MNKIMGLMALLLLACGLSGCFQVDQVVTVSPDGSGTLEETFMISRRIADSMAAIAGGMGGQQESPGDDKSGKKEQSFFKYEDIAKRAGGFGADVHFVKMQRIANEQFEGYKAVYSFTDISKLRLDQGYGGMPKQMGQGSATAPKGTEFIFTPGKTARLVVRQSKMSAAAGDGAPETTSPARESSSEELAMLLQMFDGLRVSTTLVINGKIINSNATHRTDSTIILADVDFGKILDKPELLAKMAVLQQGDQNAAMEMIRKLPGMKFDMNDELQVNFR
jgi:hypothetical protein